MNDGWHHRVVKFPTRKLKKIWSWFIPFREIFILKGAQNCWISSYTISKFLHLWRRMGRYLLVKFYLKSAQNCSIFSYVFKFSPKTEEEYPTQTHLAVCKKKGKGVAHLLVIKGLVTGAYKLKWKRNKTQKKEGTCLQKHQKRMNKKYKSILIWA